MGESLIVRRGGSGGLKATDAILRVIAPAGSTVTISKGTVSKSDQGHENASDTSLYDYYFIIHQSQFDSVNPWTVTAVVGQQTLTDTVIIDSADEYDVVIIARKDIYRSGTEYVAMISTNATSGQPTMDTYTAYSDFFRLTSTGGNHSIARITSSTVDLTYYNTLYATVKYNGPSNNIGAVFVSTSATNPYNHNAVAVSALSAASYTTLSADISALSGSYYIGACVANDKSVNATVLDVGDIYIS